MNLHPDAATYASDAWYDKEDVERRFLEFQAAEVGRRALAAKQKHQETLERAKIADLHERSVILGEEDKRLPQPMQKEVVNLRAREMGKAYLDAEKAEMLEIPPLQTLSALLASEIREEPWIIEGLMHRGGNVLLAAQRKTGKTSMVNNLARSLVDGVPFLDRFAVSEPRRVAILDFEMSRATALTWLDGQGIVRTDALSTVPLRGKGGTFRITDPSTRARWAEQLRGFDVLILDPVRPLMDSLGLDENREAGKLLSAFDALKAEAGISEGVVVHHMGHAGTNARGDSRFEDWPDAIWKLQREDPNDPGAFRFFEAQGRDVDLPRGLVSLYDGRRLAFAADARSVIADTHLSSLKTTLSVRGEMTSGQIEQLGIRGISKNTVSLFLRNAVENGELNVRTEGNKKLFSVALPSTGDSPE
ncbi:AAA family ATPase [Microbacterium panaciterrae]|uniref:AAA domain-containing protein n=1 Tax=Microbacterium panaciterrae TaxID=985759 RepID=A0ABP8P7Q4_9MICO